MFIISIICSLLLWTYWTCSFLHVLCILRSVFWIFWSNWLLFILRNAAQASHPPQSPLSSFRLGFLSTLKALCVSINVLMILYYLHAYFPPLVHQEPLGKWFICSFILAGQFKPWNGGDQWVIVENDSQEMSAAIGYGLMAHLGDVWLSMNMFSIVTHYAIGIFSDPFLCQSLLCLRHSDRAKGIWTVDSMVSHQDDL